MRNRTQSAKPMRCIAGMTPRQIALGNSFMTTPSPRHTFDYCFESAVRRRMEKSRAADPRRA